MVILPHIFQCISCQRQFDPLDHIFTCPDCGPVTGTFDVLYHGVEDRSYRGFDRWIMPDQTGHWRYRKVLPIPLDAEVPSIPVGGTPLFRSPRLETRLGCKEIFLKDDTRNPSASLKDRASSVAVCHAKWHGYVDLTTASTGNAGITLAFWAAACGVKSHVFVPARVTEIALVMLTILGAKIYRVRGNYDQAFDQCARAVEKFGWYSRNTGTNPVLGEGKKTVALEIAEQMADHPPDAVIAPVGDGCIFGALWKGFQDAQKMGWIHQIPRLYGIQAQGADPLVKAFERNEETFRPIEPNTIADSIAVGNPRDGMKALRAARLSDGGLLAVSDEAITEAVSELAREVPIFVEPASAAPLAGLKILLDRGDIQRSERVVLIMTGSGLKDIDSAKRAVRIEPVEIGISAEDLNKINT